MFLGEFDEDPMTWHHHKNLVGSDNIFASRSTTKCANCKKQTDDKLLDSDTIPLTPPLIAYWRTEEAVSGMKVESLDPPDVIPFLKRNLHWRVTDVSGAVCGNFNLR